MNPQRLVGIVLLLSGLILISIGMNASHLLADLVSNTFTGRFTDLTTWYITGGMAAGLLGFPMLLLGPRRQRSLILLPINPRTGTG